MILGHERQVAYLNSALQRGKFSHAYLFYGPEHVGKYTLAKSVAKVFHCENFHREEGLISRNVLLENVCDTCVSCQHVESGLYPHVFFLDTEHTLISKKEKRKDIPIEDIRELRRILSFAPEGGKWRIAIINEAEKMSREAADAFLKTLEEPGDQTLFLLVSAYPDLLPQTIVSRLHPIRFSLLPEKILTGLVESAVRNTEVRQKICVLAQGRPGVACTLLVEKELLATEEQFVKSIAAFVRSGSVPDAMRVADRAATNDALRKKVIEYILRIMRAEFLQSVRRGSFKKEMIEKMKEIHRIGTRAETVNVNPRLAMDVACLEATQWRRNI